MKSYVLLSVLLLIGSNVFGQSEKNRQKEPGDKEPGNTRYSEGASGVKRSISYRFVAGVHDAGTGKGTFCFDRNNLNSLTYVFADNFDLSEDDQTKWYSTWDDTTGATGRGRITLVEYEGDNTIILDVKNVLVRESGFWKIPVEYISGKMPADGKIYYYIFSRIAHGKDKDPSSPQAVFPPITEETELIAPGLSAQVIVPQQVVPEPAPEVTVPQQVVTEPDPQAIVPQQVVSEPEPIVTVPQQVIPEQEPQVTVPQQVIYEPEPKVIVPQQVIPEPEPQVTVPQQVVSEPEPKVTVPQQVIPEPEPKVTVPQQVMSEPAPQMNPSLPITNKEVPVIQTPSGVDEKRTTAAINVKDDRRRPAERSDAPYQSTEERLRQVSTVRQPEREPNTESVATSTKTTASAESQVVNKPGSQPVSKASETPKTNPPANPAPAAPATQQKGTITSRPLGNQVSDVSTAPPSYRSNLPEYRSVANQYSQGRGHGKCYSGIIEVGYGMGVGDYGINNFRFNFINGFHIGPTLTMGLGIGWRRYFPDTPSDKYLVAGKSHMPVFLDLRKRFSAKTVTPYLALGIGSSVVFVNDGDTARTEYEGLLLNPTGGIWFNISSRFAVFTGISYELQKLEFAMLSDDRRFKKNAGSVSFNIGISF